MDEETTSLSATSRPHARALVILLVCVAAVHVPSLFTPFLMDDYVYVDMARHLDIGGIGTLFRSAALDDRAASVWWVPEGALPFYRPIGQLSFWLDHVVWGARPFGFHLTNLLLHLLCTFLTWRLGLRLFSTVGWALVAAMVFALHPCHMEAVAWISGRFDLLVCALALSASLAYGRWRDTRSWRFLGLSLVLFVLALGCKETALVLPAVLIGIDLLAGRFPSGRGRTLWVALAAFGVIALGYLALRVSLFGGVAGRLPPPYGLDKSSVGSAVTGVLSNLMQYAFDFILFIQVEPAYVASWWHHHPVWMTATIAVSMFLLIAACRLAWRSFPFRVGAVWTLVFMAPSLLAMPGERNVYLACVGVAIVFASVVEAAWRRWSIGNARAGQRVLRVLQAVVAFWLLVGFAEQGFMWCVTSVGEKVLRDLQGHVPDPPNGAVFYIVNQSPLSSVGFQQAVRLRYGREDVRARALTLSPTLPVSTEDSIQLTEPDTIRIDRAGGLIFDSFVERFHLFADPVTALPGSARRYGLTLVDAPTSYMTADHITLRLPHEVSDDRMHIFIWDNTAIKSVLDLPVIGAQTRLRPWPAHGAH